MGICVLETPSTDKNDPSAIMSTDLCTSKSLSGFYGVRPTMKMLPTQPMSQYLGIYLRRLKHAFIIRRIVCTLLIPKVALWGLDILGTSPS